MDSSAPVIAFDPEISVADAGLEIVDGATIAAPLPDPDEVVLTSVDLSLIGPLSGARNDAAPVADPLIGMVVADRYRILEAVGRGGMGIVYKVEHARIGKLLAMKVLTGELSRSPEVVRRFKREALTVSRLQSPNAVQVFDFGVSGSLTYLVMELVSGDDLGRLLHAGGPMPFARLGPIVVQICNALAEAHRKGIVHRDIKPENVMIVPAEGGAEVAKVLDFGLAKLREAEGLADVTGHGMILGTPYYMAPEQIRGEEVDPRTDVYGVGALMYRLLTGYHPFGGAPMTVLSKHLSDTPVPPADRAPDLGIPPGVSRLVMRALEKEPAHRFQRIEELQALLVEEIRAAGAAGVEGLLDPARLRRLARPALAPLAIATRDEVDAYERKLRRTRYGAALVAAALAALTGAGASLAMPREAAFRGVEIEPNDTAADATAIPLGHTASGHLGRRIDASRGDRDFYAIDLPARAPGADAFLRVRLGALPNLATCLMLYRPGLPDALGQYCVGRPGKDLVIPALQLPPGRYLLAVLQDLDPHGGAPVFVHENISDAYTILAESTSPAPGVEVEPNDRAASATHLELGAPCSAAIGWTRDEDVFCAPASTSGPIRWTVRAGPRDGGVLEATPIRDGEEAGAPVRIHADDRGKLSEADVVSPWRSAPIGADGASRRCLRVRLTTDPWSASCKAVTPGGGSEPYVVEVEAIP